MGFNTRKLWRKLVLACPFVPRLGCKKQFVSQRGGTLSGGQQAMLAIAANGRTSAETFHLVDPAPPRNQELLDRTNLIHSHRHRHGERARCRCEVREPELRKNTHRRRAGHRSCSNRWRRVGLSTRSICGEISFPFLKVILALGF